MFKKISLILLPCFLMAQTSTNYTSKVIVSWDQAQDADYWRVYVKIDDRIDYKISNVNNYTFQASDLSFADVEIWLTAWNRVGESDTSDHAFAYYKSSWIPPVQNDIPCLADANMLNKWNKKAWGNGTFSLANNLLNIWSNNGDCLLYQSIQSNRDTTCQVQIIGYKGSLANLTFKVNDKDFDIPFKSKLDTCIIAVNIKKGANEVSFFATKQACHLVSLGIGCIALERPKKPTGLTLIGE